MSGKPLWPDEWTAELRRLHAASGLSASQIAAAMSLKFQHLFTRDGILGKIHRLGLSKSRPFKRAAKLAKPPSVAHAHNPSGWRGKQNKRIRKPLPQPVETFAMEATDLSSAVGIFDHKPGQCRWIVADAVPTIHHLRYCGAKVAQGEESYCEHHLCRSMRLYETKKEAA